MNLSRSEDTGTCARLGLNATRKDTDPGGLHAKHEACAHTRQ